MKATVIRKIGMMAAVSISLLMVLMMPAGVGAEVMKPANGVTFMEVSEYMISIPYLMTYTAPSPPRNLRAVAGDNVVYITWMEPKDMKGASEFFYVVQRSYDGGTTWKNLIMLDRGTTVYEDRCVANGIVILYRMVAIGDDAWSEPSEVSIARPVGVPWAPSAFHAGLEGDTVLLSWGYPLYDGGSKLKEYILFRKTERDATFVEIMRFNDTVTSYSDGDVKGNISASYYLKAVNEAGESVPSLPARVYGIPDVEEEGSRHIGSFGTLSMVIGILTGISFIGALIWVRLYMVQRRNVSSIMEPRAGNGSPSAIHVRRGRENYT